MHSLYNQPEHNPNHFTAAAAAAIKKLVRPPPPPPLETYFNRESQTTQKMDHKIDLFIYNCGHIIIFATVAFMGFIK